MEKIFLGTVKKDFDSGMIAGKRLYIDKHNWDCGWYWGFGYIGNSRLYTHFDGNLLYKLQIVDIFIRPRYTQGQWYAIQDLFKQAYALDKAAMVYQVGGNITGDRDIAGLILNKEMADKLNADLKIILDKAWSILGK